MINVGLYTGSGLHSFIAKSKEFGFDSNNKRKTLE